MKMMTDEEFQKREHDILHDNKMLYCMHSRPCIETCMTWGLEIDKGWIDIVDSMSRELEGLNYIVYPKFRVRVQMDQLKSKYATLHAYYSVVADPPKWMCVWHDFFQKVLDRVSKVDFKYVEVLDHDAYDEVVEKELSTREEFEKEKRDYMGCSNVEVLEVDGKFISRATYHHYRKTHPVPTKHKLLHKLLKMRYFIENWPMRVFDFRPSHAQNCIIEVVERKAREIIRDAEERCYEVCEQCGHYISDDSELSPRCTTRGWVAYLCKECADKTGQEYVMNEAVWKSGAEVMTKEQYAAEKEKIEARFKAAQEDEYDEEDDNED